MPTIASIRRAFDFARLRRSVRRAKRPQDPEGIASLVFSLRVGGAAIDPIQVRAELVAFLELVQDLRPQRVVEIGSEFGGTLFALTSVALPDATVVSVDLPDPDGYPRERASLYRAFARDAQRMHLIRGDSHSEETRDEVARVLGGPADVIFIDGDHSYDGVSRDWDLYRPLVRSGGIVAFHDIVAGDDEVVGGVPRFWAELRADMSSEELVDDPGQGGYGIGVVRV